MSVLKSPWRFAAACGFVVLVASACYQNIDEEGNPAALSMGLPTATHTPFPTPTDTPTPTEEVVAEAATDEPEPALDFFLEASPTLEFAFDDPNAQSNLLDFDTLQLTFNAPPPQDVLLGDIGGPFGSPTPTPITIAQIDPFSLTSTQFIIQVTETQAASFTQTAIALGIGEEPTLPPFAATDPGFFFSTPTPTPLAPGRPAVCIHIVQPGENLFRLSMRYGVSVNDLAVANGIANIQLIRVNQQITIPGCGTTGVFPPPTPLPPGVGGPGDGSVSGQSVAICSQHLVQQYETLFQISLRYGVSMQSIINANNITNPNLIIMATTLQIPCA
jgi:LysM repeat protein